MKKLLTIFLILILFSSAYADEQKTTYYPTGEVKQVQEYPDIGRMDFKSTHYHKTGEVKKVEEYVNNRISKEISHHKTGEVKMVKEYVDGLKSKTTHYHKTGELEKAYKFVGNKTLIKTSDSDEWLLIADQQIIKANNNNIKQILLDEIRRLGSDADLNHIDVSNVTDMQPLKAVFFRSKFNGDISKWDVSNVEPTGGIFAYSNDNIPKWADQLKIPLDFSDIIGEIAPWIIIAVVIYVLIYSSKKTLLLVVGSYLIYTYLSVGANGMALGLIFLSPAIVGFIIIIWIARSALRKNGEKK